MTEIPNIMTIVLAVFLSPSLPEGSIEIGKTSCEEATVVLQQHYLRLVDTEYLPLFDVRANLTVDPSPQIAAVQVVSFERLDTGGSFGGATNKSSFLKVKSPPRAGLLLCGLVSETLDP